MALVLKDRVRETSNTSGQATLVLNGAVPNYQPFSVIGNGNTTYYTIVNDSQWEVGIGTYTLSGTTLSRDTILSSSNNNNKVDFISGTKNVFLTYPAEKALSYDGSDNVGIGTTQPASRLQIVGTSTGYATPQLRIGETGSNLSIAKQLLIGYDTTNNYGFVQSNQWNTGATSLSLQPLGGNVGIGTSSPAAKLDVAGGVKLGAAGTDTITLTGQVSANSSVGSAGQVLTSQGANLPPQWATISSGSISGSGTTNYVPKFTGTSAIGNSIIYDNGANVGIGTVSPTGKLQVNGVSANTYIQIDNVGSGENYYSANAFHVFGTAGSERMRIDSAGNVGIGTGNPGAWGKLVSVVDGFNNIVAASATNGSATGFVTQEVAGATRLAMGTYGSTYTGGTWFNIGANGSGVIQSANAPLGIGTYGVAQPIIFGTNSSEKMRIDSAGNVGIGTSSPSSQLQVVGTTTTTGFVIKGTSLSTTGFAYASLQDTAERGWIGYGAGDGSFGIANTLATPIKLFTNGAERMRINSSGNVGIGTGSPAAKLDVAVGHIRLDDDYSFYWGDASSSINGNSTSDFVRIFTNSAERLRIDSSGNVGIGTNSPSVKLDVNGGVSCTTLSASSTVSGTGFSNYLASPPAIGGTTPNTITGTTVSATTLMTLPTITVGNVGTGVLQMINGLDGYDYLNIYTDDGSGNGYIANFPYGLSTTTITGLLNLAAAGIISASSFEASAGSIKLYGTFAPTILQTSNATLTTQTFTLPSSTGSANQVLKTDGAGNLDWVTQGVQGTAPVTVTTATHTVAATTQWLIANRSGTVTLTLPTASSNTGRSLNIKTITANTVVSASSNVVQKSNTTVSTAILAGTAGNWATLVSDGTNWVIMAGT